MAKKKREDESSKKNLGSNRQVRNSSGSNRAKRSHRRKLASGRETKNVRKILPKKRKIEKSKKVQRKTRKQVSASKPLAASKRRQSSRPKNRGSRDRRNNKRVQGKSGRTSTLPKRRGNRPTGMLGPVGRKPRKAKSARHLRRIQDNLAKRARKLQRELEKIRESIRARQREEQERKVSSKKLDSLLSSMNIWASALGKKAAGLGHRFRHSHGKNRDGTVDVQLSVYDWGEYPYKDRLFQFFADLNDTLPALPRGIKARTQVRISADKIEHGPKDKYGYLPMVNGQRTIYYNYVDPRSVGNLAFKTELLPDKLTSDGWRLVAIIFDLRYDPRWTREEKKR